MEYKKEFDWRLFLNKTQPISDKNRNVKCNVANRRLPIVFICDRSSMKCKKIYVYLRVAPR